RLQHVTMDLKFTDPAGIGRHSQQTNTLAAGAHAYFLVSCPFSTCFDGGFDLRGPIANLVSHQGEMVTGRLVCQGVHDRGRTGERRCMLELQYTITACFRIVSLFVDLRITYVLVIYDPDLVVIFYFVFFFLEMYVFLITFY